MKLNYLLKLGSQYKMSYLISLQEQKISVEEEAVSIVTQKPSILYFVVISVIHSTVCALGFMLCEMANQGRCVRLLEKAYFI